MAKTYFRHLPNFDYVSRLPKAQSISDYIQVKNLFKRTKINENIFQDLSYFTKYQIVGDERADNIAHRLYGDAKLDWIVLLCNNIINLENEWPLEETSFHNFIIAKYGSEEKIHNVHHYETREIQTTTGKTIIPKGLEVPSEFSITFFDAGLGTERIATDITDAITNQEYEERIQNKRRNIFTIKPNFVGLVIEEMEDIMPYEKGSTQYVSPSVVKGENIRIYQ